MRHVPRQQMSAHPQRQEGPVDVGAPLIAHVQTTKPVEPRECTFHHPPISAEPLARFDATPRDARNDAPLAQGLAAVLEVVALIRMQLRGALARPSSPPAWQSQWRNCIYRSFQHLRVVHVGARNGDGERQALAVDHKMALRPQLAAIRRSLPVASPLSPAKIPMVVAVIRVARLCSRRVDGFGTGSGRRRSLADCVMTISPGELDLWLPPGLTPDGPARRTSLSIPRIPQHLSA